MKTLSFCTLLLLSLTGLAQQAKERDTSRFRIGDHRFIIINDKGKINKDTSFKTVFAKDTTKKNKPNLHWSGFELGFTGLVSSLQSEKLPRGYEFLETNPSRLAAVNLNLLEYSLPIYKNYICLVSGLGLEWDNYFFRKSFSLTPGIDSVKAYIDPGNYSKNKLVTNWVNVPLMLEFNTSKIEKKSMHLAVGIIGSYMYRSHTKQIIDDQKRKNFDTFNLNPFRYSLTARLGFGDFNIFANYALSNFFKEGSAPEIHAYSIGITIIGF